MSREFSAYIPPVGFYYSVQILDDVNLPYSSADASFQEVSGISATLETEQIPEGGENRFVHQVPERVSYENLVLKRGVMVRSSVLAEWCSSVFQQNLNTQIEPKTIVVALLDANTEGNGAIMSWVFTNAYPIKWEVSSLNAQKREIVVESITFAYSYFEEGLAPAASNTPPA